MGFHSLLDLLVHRLLLFLNNVPLLVLILATALAMIFWWILPSNSTDPGQRLPFINGPKWYEISTFMAKNRFLKDAATLIQSGFNKSTVFRMIMDNGVIMVLHPKYANEIRTNEALSFSESLAEDFHAHIPGFDPFTSERLIHDVIRTKLTKKLEYKIKPLCEETVIALDEWPVDKMEWHELPLRDSILELVARLTSNTLLGNEIGRNPAWRKIMVHYTVDAFVAAYILRLFPKFLRPLASRFIPQCRKLRRELDEARRIINPVLESREGRKFPQGSRPDAASEDGFDWLEQCANGLVYDPVVAQLSLSVVAIHTTSEKKTQVLFDLAERPEVIDALREEITEEFDNDLGGLTRGSLQKLKLMDSVLKESQRIKPVNIVSMRRRANHTFQLSDGILAPKGTMLCVSNHLMWDVEIYKNPEHFDPRRFYKQAESTDYDFSTKFVSPSPEHLGFGLGRHVCPGRFFAATEIKIILCHVLLKYDISLPKGFKPRVSKIGATLSADLFGKVLLRRRV